MPYLYNIVQIILLIFLGPLFLVYILLRPKYRSRLPARLGLGLAEKIKHNQSESQEPVFWLHALSLGEVRSALSLVRELRRSFPNGTLVVSASTQSGKQYADKQLRDIADAIVDSPLDILPVVELFYKTIKPSIFILVETDFWPNLLYWLQKKGCPTLLVNGRISERSMQNYQRLRFFFRPIFQSFSQMTLQRKDDCRHMTALGVANSRIQLLGNLKFDKTLQANEQTAISSSVSFSNKTVIVCGSTHAGEEEILLKAYSVLCRRFAKLLLLIAPRQIERASAIEDLARKYGCTSSRRSEGPDRETDIVILDTLGELPSYYGLATISFVGGSLVPQRGHDPIEPAAYGVPVLFGRYMEDFNEVAQSLLECGGAHQVKTTEELTSTLSLLLSDQALRERSAAAAKQLVLNNQGSVKKHIELIESML